jgi:hypothetical protein
VLPGAGGYQLHAHRLSLQPPVGEPRLLQAALPASLNLQGQ